MLEKGWIGGGNTGRNTTIIRSNYLWDESAAIYEKSLQLYEGLSRELNFNIMLSQRGVLNLAHNEHDLKEMSRRVRAIRGNGVDSEILTPEEIKKLVPAINISRDLRYPILGASLQRRGGVARHDAVAWGFARAADDRGVDIIQNCEVTGSPARAAGSPASRRPSARSGPARSASWWPAMPACWRRWPDCACRSTATPCRPWSANRSSRCWIVW